MLWTKRCSIILFSNGTNECEYVYKTWNEFKNRASTRRFASFSNLYIPSTTIKIRPMTTTPTTFVSRRRCQQNDRPAASVVYSEWKTSIVKTAVANETFALVTFQCNKNTRRSVHLSRTVLRRNERRNRCICTVCMYVVCM